MPDNFFLYLKSAREAKNISLAEISDATLISLKMLEALERGDMHMLPQPYVRAFIREYAAVVDLDKDEVMRKYDAWLGQASSVKPTEAFPPSKHEPPKEKPKPTIVEPIASPSTQPIATNRFKSFAPKLMVAIGVVIAFNFFLWKFLGDDTGTSITEVPFRDVVKQHEAGEQDTLQTGFARGSDSTLTSAHTPPTFSASGDSLTLVGTTTDSVWMEIVMDDDILAEHYIQPNTRMTWKAKNEFWITSIGNPDAIKFMLNNKAIRFPYKSGAVARDIRITRDSVFVQQY